MGEIFNLKTTHLPEAVRLVRQVFDEFDAPDCTKEGQRRFHEFIKLPHLESKFSCGELLGWGYRLDRRLVGVLVIRPPQHVSLLFVDRGFQRRGIGRRLLAAYDAFLQGNEYVGCITVNASLNGRFFYERLGFSPLGPQQFKDGIHFQPMQKCVSYGTPDD